MKTKDKNTITTKNELDQKNVLMEIKDLSITKGTKKLINNLSIDISIGDIISIIGSNGSGKTTLAKTIAGLSQKYSGTIRKAVLTKISYTPQSFSPPSHISISVKNFMKIQNATIAETLLKELHIEHLMKKLINEISGGEMRKVLFYIAISRPESNLIILDEPETHLDEESVNAMINAILENRDKKAFLIITHSNRKILQYSKPILKIKRSIVHYENSIINN